MGFKIREIKDGEKHSWIVLIDGVEQKVGKIEIISKFGEVIYGMRPEGYDSWCFHEQGGGGTVTIPYSLTPRGELLVGLISEKRPNMGENPVWCAIGGFIEPKETHENANIREANEETGLDAKKAKELPGPFINPNRAFFITDSFNEDLSKREGTHFYGLEVPYDKLDGDYKLSDPNFFTDFKKAGNIRFFNWGDAIKCTSDALALSGIAKLFLKIREE